MIRVRKFRSMAMPVLFLVTLGMACSNQPESQLIIRQEENTPPPKKQPAIGTVSATQPISPLNSLALNQLPTLAEEATAVLPYPDAPLCSDSGEAHNNNLFHTLWDGSRGCHYDHEHGQSPFISEVVATFPDFDLQALIGGVEVGHTNPSSPMENTHKHGGFKWDVTLSHSTGCAGGEGATVGVDSAVIQYHAFGDYSVEFESRIHSALTLLRQCLASNPNDFGYVYVVQHQDYGQRIAPYQGNVLSYPDTPLPAYNSGLKPYFTVDCFSSIPPCDKYPSLQYVLDHNLESNSLWVSDPLHLDKSGSSLFNILFRVRDTYQMLDWNDQNYPFTFAWLCSTDSGSSYSPSGCRYNNTTTRVHQVAGEIPSDWDNLVGWDTDTRIGRITAEGFVTHFGELNLDCTAPSPDCFPTKLVEAFVGRYGSLFVSKEEAANKIGTPDRDVYFCGRQICAETDSGAIPSGWAGQNN